jgi:hypothetical protein
MAGGLASEHDYPEPRSHDGYGYQKIIQVHLIPAMGNTRLAMESLVALQ